ncbi:major facilitator superfamily transporter [Paramyrothecium foliicola]|nr:major facilitator superfamily transporter [Paramyrothecium foliicola]
MATAASSVYTSTYSQMTAEFNSSRIIATLGLSTFVLGISFGPMIFGPLSEFYGRRPIYLVAWSMYLIWLIPEAVSQNMATVIVCRFFDGLSGSAFLAVSGGTVSDLFTREKLQAPMLLYSLAPFLGPAVGPLLGGFINYYTSWRWTYYVLIIWAFVMLLLIVFLVPETYLHLAYDHTSDPIVLRHKAKRLRKETGEERWKAPIETANKSMKLAIGRSLLRPFQLLAYEIMVMVTCLFSAVLLGILYLFFGAFPLVFGNLHGFNLWQVGLSFMGIFVGMILAALGDFLYHHQKDKRLRTRTAQGAVHKMEPEDRLPPAVVGAFLVTGGLFIFAWTSFDYVHWIAPIIGSGVFGAGTLLVFTGIFTFLVDAYPSYAASALAANAFVRCIFAAAFPLFGNQMYNKLGYPWASSLLAFLTLALLPFPFIFWRYGYKIRQRNCRVEDVESDDRNDDKDSLETNEQVLARHERPVPALRELGDTETTAYEDASARKSKSAKKAFEESRAAHGREFRALVHGAGSKGAVASPCAQRKVSRCNDESKSCNNLKCQASNHNVCAELWIVRTRC